MRKFYSLLVVLMLSCLTAMADAWTPEKLPVPKNTKDSTQANYVCNPDGVLSAEEVERINSIMFQLDNKQGVRGLVIAVKEIDPDDPYEFTIEVGNLYGIGGKSSTGFIVMVASVSRCYEIMPGDGLEKFLTDGQCSTIGREYMVPLLKEDKWGEAVLAGVEKVAGVCSGEEELVYDGEADSDDGGNILLWMGGGLAGLIGFGAYKRRKAKQCPHCKNLNYKIKLRYTVLAQTEEGAPSEEEINEQIQSKLLAMKVQKNSAIADMARKLVESVEAPVKDAIAEDEDEEEDVMPASGEEDKVLKVGDVVVTPAVAAAALKIAEEKTAFDSKTMELTKEQRAAKRGYRNVRLIDTYECPDCGYLGRKEKSSTSQIFKLGLFTSGTFGAISWAGKSRGGSYRSGGSSGRSSGGYSSSSSSRSWGSSGGGHFGGGGAGGRF